MSRYYGYINNQQEVIIADIIKDTHYNLNYEEDLEEFLLNINKTSNDCGVLYGIKHEIIDDIETLTRLDKHFTEEDPDTVITCFGMVKNTLITLYNKLYKEEYDGG